MVPIIETKLTATFYIKALGNTFLLKLYKRKHIKQIIQLKKASSLSCYSMNQIGEFLYNMEMQEKKGVFNGVDYLKILNIEFI